MEVLTGALIAGVGAAIGLAAGLAFRASEASQRARAPAATPLIPPGADEVLSVLRHSVLLLNDQLEVVKASPSAYAFGVVRQSRLALDRSRVDAETSHIRLASGGHRGLQVLGNESQLSVALGNLVENAVAYSPPHTQVMVGVRRPDDRVEVSVTDQGYGIPEPEQERIFERFYRIDPARSRATGGTGLGLSIVKHVAASHGGEVKVRSAPGAGSTFTLRLPLHQARHAHPPMQASTTTEATT